MLYRIATTIVFLVVFFGNCSTVYCQKIARFELNITKDQSLVDIPVELPLDPITSLHDSLLSLEEVIGRERKAVPCQLENKYGRTLVWIIRQDAGGSGKKIFELVKKQPQAVPAVMVMVAEKNDGALIISSGAHNLIRYQYGIAAPPSGASPAFRRSGFIHPVWTLNGHELTRLSPADHYHHFGLWNPWTKVLFEKDTVDFWNLGSKQGTVRFAGFISVNKGSVYSEYEVLHEHVAFKKGGEEKVALNELQSVRVYQPASKAGYYIIDITSRLNAASESPVVLKAYRYGGLGFRATEKWTKDNSETLTSEGKARKEADGSKARWCIVQGSLGNDYGGILMMSSPQNYNHPEPLRIWPENSNGRGDVFANFSPTKDKDWVIETGKDYLLKYRLLVFNGKLDREKAEAAWIHFARQPQIIVKLNN